MIKPGYKRLETDEEFRARVDPLMPDRWTRLSLYDFTKANLDIYVWDVCQKQRRVVEVFP